MNNNRVRHKILKVLHQSFNDINGAGLTPNEIQSKAKIDEISLISLITEFHRDQYISANSTHYILTPKGVNAYKDKIFLNKVWYRSIHIWISIITVTISTLALIISLKK